MPGASNISKFLDGNSLRAIKTYVDGKSGSIPNEFIDSAFMGGPSIDYTEDFATLYPIPDTLSDTDGTHRVLFSETQLREVAGNSIAYNQLASNDALSNIVEGITMTNNGDGSFTLNGTATENSYIRLTSTNIFFTKGRKYLFTGMDKVATSYTTDQMLVYVDAPYTDFLASKLVTIGEQPTRETAFFLLTMKGVTFNNLVIRPQLFDLTLMGLDSVSTVEEAKSELLKRGIDIDQYNPYSEGEIRNTTASGVKVNGYNLFDGELRKGYYINGNYSSPGAPSICNKNVIKVSPNKTYKLERNTTLIPSVDEMAVVEYDKNMSFIKKTGVNTATLTVTLTSKTEYCSWWIYRSGMFDTVPSQSEAQVCFHLVGSRTGYAPYKEPKAISFASTELLGAGEAHDTIEVVEGDKVAGIQRYNLVHVKRVGTVDLGTLSWISYTGLGDKYVYQAPLNDMKLNAGLTCSKLVQVKAVYASGDDYSISSHPTLTKVYARTSNYEETSTAFKTAMSGVILNYELATPTRTTIAENLTFEEVSATIEQGGSIETIYETLAPNCTTGFVVDKDVIIQEGRYLDENGLYTLVSNISSRYALKSSIGGTITDTYINSLF